MVSLHLLLLGAVASYAAVVQGAIANSSVLLFAGGSGGALGVRVFQFNLGDGSLTLVNSTPAGASDPRIKNKFIAGAHGRLYLASEVYSPPKNTTSTGWLHAVSFDADGTLKEINHVESQGGVAAHISTSPDHKFVTTASYAGGNVGLYPVESDGAIGASIDFHQYEKGPRDVSRMHCMTWIGKGSSGVFGADLGNDRIAQFSLDAQAGKLVPNAQNEFISRPYGSGPRHIAIHPTRKYAYVVAEIGNTIGVYDLDASTGTLSVNATQSISTLPEGYTNVSTGGEIYASSKFVYASNRGHDSIAIFKIAKDGTLTTIGYESTRGQVPRSFAVYKDYLVVANQKSNNIQVFRIDQTTGLLTYTGKSADCESPVTLFIPSDC